MRELALGLTLIGYVLLMRTNPVRASLGDGWRCIRRYPVIWRTLAWLAFANALFLFAARLVAHWHGEPQLVWMRPGWNDPGAWLAGTPDSLWWMPASTIRELMVSSVLPALETVAGLFNNVVTTFPLAVLAAVGLILNHRRGLAQLWKVLRRRFGVWALLLLLCVLVCAAATIAKAVLYFRPAWVPEPWWLQWGPATAAVAALFEYLFGVAVQAYLLLHAYAWVRGLSFQKDAMREVALRRFGAAAKWAGLVLLAQALFIELPLVLAFARQWPARPEAMSDWLSGARAILSGTLVLCASMQAWLTLHGETLGRAWRAHWRMLGRHAWSVGWFLIIAAVHCFALQFLRAIILQGLGEDTAPGVLWTLMWPLVFGLVAGWLLAAWVCLFKRSE
jgi:hypothetical protein